MIAINVVWVGAENPLHGVVKVRQCCARENRQTLAGMRLSDQATELAESSEWQGRRETFCKQSMWICFLIGPEHIDWKWKKTHTFDGETWKEGHVEQKGVDGETMMVLIL
jgi:hypothetical protein